MKGAVTVSLVFRPYPACGELSKHIVLKGDVARCESCGCVNGTCYLGDSYTYAIPGLVEGEAHRAYDLTCLGSAGITRRHGWVDAANRVVQVG